MTPDHDTMHSDEPTTSVDGDRGRGRDRGRPGRTLRSFLRSPVARAPVALYHARLGWLLGHRLLLLVHRGRRTHRLHRTVLEVVAWHEADQEAVVVSGLGPDSQWYRNVLAAEAVEIRIARRRFAPKVRQLDTEEAAQTIADYERRNRMIAPLVRAGFSALAGFRYDGSDAARRRLVETLPLVAFRPSDHATPERREGESR
jgi:deazaflavin-dependent oxidoreductase (nitroreductase family)